mmetsp:Transcript_43601/g.102497  ORF Transcript_43601/g.102497 Transcript_43601/m.102497 type:complete len:406 (-) Transcript_43601:242-1459(-)
MFNGRLASAVCFASRHTVSAGCLRSSGAGTLFLRLLSTSPRTKSVDVAVIGAGSAGLSVAALLQKQGVGNLVVLDDNSSPGGSWQHRWESLSLFSTRKWSSLPFRPMQGEPDGYPSTAEMAKYLAEYEQNMKINVERPVNIISVETLTDSDELLITSDTNQQWKSKAVVTCTGGDHSPICPAVPGSDAFMGKQLHSAEYKNATPFAGKRVVVVGEGNSGAQILADVSIVAADVMWVTSKEPEYLPKEMSGKEVFDTADKKLRAFLSEPADTPADNKAIMLQQIPSLSKIICVPSVRDALERGVLDKHKRPFSHFTPRGLAWEDGSTWDADAVIWCTGYGNDTHMLRPLNLVDERGRAVVKGTRSKEDPRVWLVGYGHWTGIASRSIPGAVLSAQATAAEIRAYLQ